MKTNKVKIMILALIIIVIGFGCFFFYNKFFGVKEVIKQEKDIISLDNDFYSVNSLIVNHYITLIKNTEQRKYSTNEEINPYVIKIDSKKVMVANDLALDDKDISLVEAKGIEGIPTIVKYASYGSVEQSVFFVLTKEGDLFYADVSTLKDTTSYSIVVNEFKKINNQKILNIYDFYINDNITYPWHPLTVYAETSYHDLLKVKNGKVTTSFKDNYPFPDQICGGWNSTDGCMGLYISPERYLYLMKDVNKRLYQEILFKDEKISVKDAFSITNIKEKDDNAVLDSIKYYIIGKDNYLYEIVENANSKITSIKRYNSEEIISYNFGDDNDKYVASINYKDGSKDHFKDVSVFSSIYYRYNK